MCTKERAAKAGTMTITVHLSEVDILNLLRQDWIEDLIGVTLDNRSDITIAEYRAFLQIYAGEEIIKQWRDR